MVPKQYCFIKFNQISTPSSARECKPTCIALHITLIYLRQINLINPRNWCYLNSFLFISLIRMFFCQIPSFFIRIFDYCNYPQSFCEYQWILGRNQLSFTQCRNFRCFFIHFFQFSQQWMWKQSQQ
ncbi:hypothetical protein IMG5_143290 [Ichthyophthirius multifiliis]|uniref:Transmembrane protein n=1 Tax=Ichthyophthirius multifiliis TaxID=5932 RepID=G0QXJ1_ICHMU|nr:hypothetical protein IMG5_143290 [Ichthyophthirius multifiliis]EGR30057.1 hypothetical protein IMG5_143290 [Ichthyophthirius multifiliis]|eukprot:XP_004031293.1 hypothetical protein IMG5_143290 [Ichthyophthirius multifiliis]